RRAPLKSGLGEDRCSGLRRALSRADPVSAGRESVSGAADRLEPMTVAALAAFPWSEVWGQDGAVETLQQAAADPTMLSHAWLITGPPGSGRSTLAYAFAAALIAEHPDDVNTMRQVLAGTHPDL